MLWGGCVGGLTATLKLKVSPEPSLLFLVNRYVNALRYTVNWIIDNRELRLSRVHKALYKNLKEEYGLPSRIAVDCYREALSIAKSWFKNPRRGRKPIIKTKRVWLTPKLSYRLNLSNMKVHITGVGKVKIIGYPSNIKEYLNWNIREARLIVRENGIFLHVVVKKHINNTKPSLRVIAVDINEHEIVYGFQEHIVRDKTRVKECIRIKKYMERLQRKYSFGKYRAWISRRGILKRIKELGRRIRNITEDFVRKEAKRIIDFTIIHGMDTIVIEDLSNLNKNLKKLRKPWRERLVYMTYRKLLWWIEWEAKKHGLVVVKVNPRGTSTTCPYCNIKMISTGYRKFRCLICGFESDRDTIAVINLIVKHISLEMGVVLTRPTAPQMKDVYPNRCGELMNTLKGIHTF